MSDHNQVLTEINNIEEYVKKGYHVSDFKEDLYGAQITWRDDENTEMMRVSTADGRKYITTYMISQYITV